CSAPMEGSCARAVLARAVLGRAPGLNAAALDELIAAAGGELERALDAPALRAVELPDATRSFIGSPDERAVAADLAWLAARGARGLVPPAPDSPPLGRKFWGAPPVLSVLASVPALSPPHLAIVGPRSPTPAGSATAREFAAFFARAGLTITSGLALG